MPELRGLSWRQLRALSATVATGSVTEAAKALGVTPPAVTIQLKQLEAVVGAPVFDRARSGFTPTEIGKELLGTAHDIDRLVARSAERVSALLSGATGSVVFGVVSTGKYIAPAIVASFRRAHPDIRVTLAVGNRGEIIRGLERNEYDLLLMGRPPGHVDVDSVVLGDHPHVLIAAPDHRLAGDRKIRAEDLLQERFLAREPGSGTRVLMERFLARLGAGRPPDVVEMGTNETIKQSVLAGLGIAILSAHACMTELKDGRLAALAYVGLPLVRQWFLLHRRDRELTTAARHFLDHAKHGREDFFPRVPPH